MKLATRFIFASRLTAQNRSLRLCAAVGFVGLNLLVHETAFGQNLRLSLSSVSSNNVQFQWNSQAGYIYQLQFKTNLAEQLWTSVLGDVVATNTASQKSHNPLGVPVRFFRLVELGLECIPRPDWQTPCITNAYYAGDVYYAVQARPLPVTRGFDEAFLRFTTPRTNITLILASRTKLEFVSDIATEGSWWRVTDGISSGNRTNDLNNLLAELKSDPNIVFAFPVYHGGPGEFAWGGENLLIHLKPGYGYDTIRDLAAKYNFELIRDGYEVRRREPKVGDAFQITAELRSDPRVANAYPSLITGSSGR